MSQFNKDLQLLMDLDAVIENIEEAAKPPSKQVKSIIHKLIPCSIVFMPLAQKASRKKLEILKRSRSRLRELIEKEHAEFFI